MPGFVAYYGLRSGDELTTVGICRDRAGTDETAFRAAERRDARVAGAGRPDRRGRGKLAARG